MQTEVPAGELGRYEIVRRIASGGMADVYEGLARGAGGFRRRVALKVMRPPREDDTSFTRMFLDEARIASCLHHDHIVSVLDFGRAPGVVYQVLELVDGSDAGHLARRGLERGEPMPVVVAVHLAICIARGLEHAHTARDADGRALGIVHRDVSPSNILVSRGGDVKLADFGIAVALDRTERTETNAVKGKLMYMAPEQLAKETLDARADVFSLGCTLHALIAGHSPLRGQDAIIDVIGGQPVPLSPAIPDDLQPVLRRALASRRADRIPDAASFASALVGVLAARGIADGRHELEAWLARLDRTGAAPAPVEPEAEPLQVTVAGPALVSTPRPTEARPGRGAVALVLTTCGLLVAVGVGTWREVPLEAVESPPSPTAGAPIERASADGPRAAIAPDPPAPSRPPSQAPAREVVEARAPTGLEGTTEATPDERPRGAGPRPARREPPPRPPTIDEPVPSGFLAVGGEGALRARIRVDGRDVGFAPRVIELPEGGHELHVVAEDGRELLRQEVSVSAASTRSRPLRISLP